MASASDFVHISIGDFLLKLFGSVRFAQLGGGVHGTPRVLLYKWPLLTQLHHLIVLILSPFFK